MHKMIICNSDSMVIQVYVVIVKKISDGVGSTYSIKVWFCPSNATSELGTIVWFLVALNRLCYSLQLLHKYSAQVLQ